MRISFKTIILCGLIACLAACSSTPSKKSPSYKNSSIKYKGKLNDPIMVITLLSEQQYEWAGTPYTLGGQSRSGIDCSGFVQKTFLDRFGIKLARQTKDQAKQGQFIEREEIQTGDLVFFKTGRGPHGYHVGIYVKDSLFLHASTKGGVIYSSMESDYWRRTYWQARRI